MKMTLVVDTEDIKGMEASHKMISTLCRQYNARAESLHSEQRFQKIAFMKALRAYMKQQMDAVESDDLEFKDMRNLRGAKQFADAIWNGWRP